MVENAFVKKTVLISWLLCTQVLGGGIFFPPFEIQSREVNNPSNFNKK